MAEEMDIDGMGVRARIGQIGARAAARVAGHVPSRNPAPAPGALALALFALVATATAPAHAACPSAADMDRAGVWIESDDGALIHYRREGPSVMETVIYDDERYWTHAYLGVYVVEDGAFRDGVSDPRATTAYRFPVPLDTLPYPAPGAEWQGEIVVKSADGARYGPETYSVAFGSETTLAIAECGYRALPFETRYRPSDGGGSRAQLRYLPELGVSILMAGGPADEPLVDFYRPVAISAGQR